MTGRDGNVSAREHRAFAVRTWTACLAGVIALAALLGSNGDVSMQSAPPAEPLAAEPEPNTLLATTPDRISVTFAEPVDLQSASVRVLRAGGGDVPLGPIQGDDAVVNRISTRPQALLGLGDYTVLWSARRAVDGEVLAGAYPFRTGVAPNPGAARLDGEWPALWAVIPRWLVFLGTSIAAGGFIWARLLASGGGGAPGSPVHSGTMALGALAALLAAALLPLLNRVLSSTDDPLPPLAETLWAMPLGWWIQLFALFVLALLCLGVLASGRTTARVPVPIFWVGLGSGLAALVGLSLTDHALSLGAARALAFAPSTLDTGAIPLVIAHQSSTALWLSGLLYLAAGWRELGSDVARFRRVRWIGGVLLAVSIVTGLAGAWARFASLGDLLTDRYGQVLTGKGAIVLFILLLGLVVMILPRRLNATRTGRSLVTQGVLALIALFLAAVLALMALPGSVMPATLVGVAQADVVPVDRAAFGMESATIHLLTQPVAPGAQTLIVLLTDGHGAALALVPAPEVEVTWTPLTASTENDEPEVETTVHHVPLQPGPSGALFAGMVTLPGVGWWQADVTVTPAGGVAARARFWLVLPDPNVTGTGPDPTGDLEAQALFARGLESLTSLRSVRYTQRLGDGGGSLYRSQTAVNAADAERPPAYADTIIDDAGDVVARQIIVGDRRWILVGEDWVDAEPIPFFIPAEWGEAYIDATGFQLGPREEVDGELCQVVTFWQPPRASPSRAPAWFAWWIGLASGELRREAMVSTRHYMVYSYSDFDAPLGITPPVDVSAPALTPATPAAPPLATPATSAD